MPAKKKAQTANIGQEMRLAIEQIAQSKSISEEAVIEALAESMKAAYIKSLGLKDVKDENNEKLLADPEAYCRIDLETGSIELGQVKEVKEEVNDDATEMELEDAQAIDPKAKLGDRIEIPASLENARKALVDGVKSNFRQKIQEAERNALYVQYQDRIGEMINAVVERCDDRGMTINIGKTTLELDRRKDMIGDEHFETGERVKVYIEEVKVREDVNGKGPKGPQIRVTRSSVGFLKRLLEDIPQIGDGDVVIKAIARQAGVRSKVAVMSTKEDLEPAGACIGAGGTRIAAIVAQLGRNTEKVDIVRWFADPEAYIIQAMRPVKALGVLIEEPLREGDAPIATVVIPNGDSSVAVGKKGANIRLASEMTGYHIEVIEEKYAIEDELHYSLASEVLARAEEAEKAARRAEFLKKTQEEAAKAAPVVEEKKPEVVAPVVTPVAPKANVSAEDFPAEAINPAAAALAEARKQDAERKALEEAKAKEEVEEKISVKTTTNLADLEAQLESSKEKKTTSTKTKKPRKITEEEVKREVKPTAPTVDRSTDIYSEEELAEMNKEDEEAIYNDYDEDDKYSEYDDDSYYDDEGGR